MPKRTGPEADQKYRQHWRRQAKPIKKELRKSDMMSLMRRGYTQAEIAEELGVSPSTVNNLWYEVRTEMRRKREEDTKEQVQLMIDELEEVKREAWREWERSKEPITEVHQKKSRKSTKSPQSLEVSQITKGRVGDPRYLTIVQNAIDAQCELLALFPPKGQGGPPAPIISWNLLMGMVTPPTPQELQAQLLARTQPVAIEGKVVQPESAYNKKLGEVPEYEEIPTVIHASPPEPETLATVQAPTPPPVVPGAPRVDYPDTIEGRIKELTERAKAMQKVKAQEEVKTNGPDDQGR